MLTKEQKIKVLCQYIGQKGVWIDPDKPEGTPTGIDLTQIKIFDDHSFTSMLKIYLEPIDNITPDHALQLVDILVEPGYRYFSSEKAGGVCRMKFDKMPMNSLYDFLWVEFNAKHTFVSVGIFGKRFKREEITMDGERLLLTYDKLREWGYAVNYMGENLFENGIAVEK